MPSISLGTEGKQEGKDQRNEIKKKKNNTINRHKFLYFTYFSMNFL